MNGSRWSESPARMASDRKDRADHGRRRARADVPESSPGARSAPRKSTGRSPITSSSNWSCASKARPIPLRCG